MSVWLNMFVNSERLIVHQWASSFWNSCGPWQFTMVCHCVIGAFLPAGSLWIFVIDIKSGITHQLQIMSPYNNRSHGSYSHLMFATPPGGRPTHPNKLNVKLQPLTVWYIIILHIYKTLWLLLQKSDYLIIALTSMKNEKLSTISSIQICKHQPNPQPLPPILDFLWLVLLSQAVT